MVCSRKIHDEKNVFEGITGNIPFILVWLFIVIGQIGISFTGKFFHLHSAGLSWQQHVQAMTMSLVVFIVNFILKFVPDNVIPFALGPDSVYDRTHGEAEESVDKGEPMDDEARSNAINN